MRPGEISSPICEALESDLNAFMDGELKEIEAQRVTKHLDGCPHCQEFIETLRSFARLHQDAFNPEAVLNGMDGAHIFKNITKELVEEKIQKIAELFYQVGKAYLVRGFNTKARSRAGKKVTAFPRRRPLAIGKSKLKTGRLFREISDLSKASNATSRQVGRARSFFKGARTQETDSLETGRRFMEESLVINPDRAEPRIYLGCYFFLVKKSNEKAREQYRKVLTLSGLSEENRVETLMNLGLTFSSEYRYDEALACFRDVAKSEVARKNPRYYRAPILQAITFAKLGRFDEAISAFGETIKDFPKRVDQIRKDLWEMRTFQNVVQTHPGFRKTLEERIPVLFAS